MSGIDCTTCTGDPKNWNGFFAGIADDEPLAAGLAVARTLAEGHDVAYLTGRPEQHRRATQAWLHRHELPPGPLLMRADEDRRPARVIKLAMLRRLAAQASIAIFVDDDPAVCAAALAAGFPVLVADWGMADARPGEQEALRVGQAEDGRT